MDNIYFLRKSLDGAYYVEGIDNDAGYDIKKLALNYPEITFIVVNDDNDCGFRNVLTKSQILNTFGVDNNLKIKCEKCGNKRKYIKSICGCGESSEVPTFLKKVLGEDYTKACCDLKVENFLKGGKSIGVSFDPVETSDLSFTKSALGEEIQKGGQLTFPCSYFDFTERS